jgi:hypothetical protein
MSPPILFHLYLSDAHGHGARSRLLPVPKYAPTLWPRSLIPTASVVVAPGTSIWVKVSSFPRVAVGLLNITSHSKDTDDLAAMVDTARMGPHRPGNIDRREGAVFEQEAMGRVGRI